MFFFIVLAPCVSDQYVYRKQKSLNFLINLVLLQIEYAVSQKRVTCENTKAFFYYL